jgi:hypothetical protein
MSSDRIKKYFKMMQYFCFVIAITGLSRLNTGIDNSEDVFSLKGILYDYFICIKS